MKYNQLLLLKSPRLFSIPRGWFTFDATGASVGMGLGMLLATVMPQFTWAQEQASGSRQQVRQTRKDELRLKAEDGVQKDSLQKNNVVTLAAVEATKTTPRLAEVVTAVPKLNEKRLSPEELRELRRQLLQQR